MKRFAMAAAMAAMLPMAPAQAATITFDALSIGSTFASYSESGVTFSPVSGGTFLVEQSPTGSPSLLEDSTPRNPTRADIAGGANVVSVDLGDFNQDEDRLFLRAFNAADTLLGEQVLSIDASDSTMHTLSLSLTGIAYVLFGSESPSANGSSVFIDNFTFDTAVVPVPAALPLMVFGLAGLGIAARRRRH